MTDTVLVAKQLLGDNMLNRLFGRKETPKPTHTKSWRETPAFLQYLSRYLIPKEPVIEDEEWERVLKVKPSVVNKRFLQEGVLKEGELPDKLAYLKATELKEILKRQRQKLSGKKDDLVQRVLAGDLTQIGNAIDGVKVLACSGEGQELAQSYVDKKAEEEKQYEDNALQFIRDDKPVEAFRLAQKYWENQVFGPYHGIDWSKVQEKVYVEPFNLITEIETPLYNKFNISDDEIESVQIGAKMALLMHSNQVKKRWGLPNKIGDGSDMNEVALILIRQAGHVRELLNHHGKDYLLAVYIYALKGSCDECRKYHGRGYALDKVPLLPHLDCKHKKGCRCSYRYHLRGLEPPTFPD